MSFSKALGDVAQHTGCRFAGSAFAIALASGACAPAPNVDVDEPLPSLEAPETYSFLSRFPGEGEAPQNSVRYGGQSARHVLIAQLKNRIGALKDESFTDSDTNDVVALLQFDYDFKNAGGADSDPLPQLLQGTGSLEQQTFGDVGSLVSLKEKVAGIDNPYPRLLLGVADENLSPDELIQAWFTELADMVVQRGVDGNIPKDPAGNDIVSPFVMPDGRDLQQLLHKFLYGAVAYSQAADDYLDDDTEGKGLLSDNSQAVAGAPYTTLEHAWDEGFGYFGAARDYASYTDEEIAGKGGRSERQHGYFDADGNGLIDVGSELNLGHALNAAKRDLSAAGKNPDFDLTRDAFDAFVQGRTLISNAQGDLNDDDFAKLQKLRDDALGAWEKAIAATIVHYINDTLADMAAFGTDCENDAQNDCYRFLDHAKHWSEMKGFALALQFNPNAMMPPEDQEQLHGYMGLRPVLPNAEASDIQAYQTRLLDARALLGRVYGFSNDLLGDDMGKNGF